MSILLPTNAKAATFVGAGGAELSGVLLVTVWFDRFTASLPEVS